MGHYCRICGRERANEKFSGKGYKKHVCKECSGKKINNTEPLELFDDDEMIDYYDIEIDENDDADDEDLPF